MHINQFLEELDALYEGKKLQEVEPLFVKALAQAVEEKDVSAQFTILNEMMGFFRDTSQYEKSIRACHQCLELMKEMGIAGSVDYATSLQNIANAHRAAGLLRESLGFYEEAFAIYEKNIPAEDYRFASLNNNIALLYQEMGDFEMAVVHLKKALAIIEQIEDAEIEVATTHTNLATSLLEVGKTEEAVEHLEKALATFQKDEVKNFHYSAALSAMAAAQCKLGAYEKAVPLYEDALKEIEINMGRGSAYQITEENLRKVREKVNQMENTVRKNVHGDVSQYEKTDIISKQEKEPVEMENASGVGEQKQSGGIALAEQFYREYGAPMIHEKFPEYESQIAVGFVGEGSERFGFDDAYSMDHDFGPGFCLWVSEETYAQIGEKLQAAYNELPTTYQGVTRVDTVMAQGRVGVQVIGDFYEKYTGYRTAPNQIEDWINLEDYKLATVTNGKVFRDDVGIFTEIRAQFLHQPEIARRVKLARMISAMAQTGQCNYGRSMARKDYVTAQICIAEFMQQTMRCLFLLNRKYAPYYKWMLQGTKRLEILPEVGDILRALADMPDQRAAWEQYQYNNMKINENDQKALTIEIVAKLILHELENQQLVSNVHSNFLNDYVAEVMKK